MGKIIWISLVAPAEVLGCAFVGAWRGAVEGARNVRDAWRNTHS